MAIPELALRVATVMALRGRTLVGANVFDEPFDPIHDALDGGAEGGGQPVIAVFTSLTVAKVMGNDYLAAERDIELTIQTYLPDNVVLPGGLKVDTRNSGAKLIMDLIERQVERVLLIDQTPWARMRQQLQFCLHEVKSASFIVETQSDLRVAARETVFKIDTIAAPNFGTPLGSPWDEFIVLLQADAHLAPLAAVISAEITGPDAAPDWQIAQAALGTLYNVPKALGINTGLDLPVEDTVEVDEIAIVNEDGGGIVVDDGSIVTEDD